MGFSHKSPRQSVLSNFVAFVAYSLLVSAPAVLATIVDEQLTENGIAYFGATVSGIVAYSIVCIQFVLAARFESIERPFGASVVFRFHKTMAIVATLLALIHLGLLIWIRGDWLLLLYAAASWPVQLGRVAGASLLITLVYSFGRKRIPMNNIDWRFFHSVLAWMILTSGFVHSIVMGSSFENPLFAVVWIGYFAFAILAWMHKWKLRSLVRTSTKSVQR